MKTINPGQAIRLGCLVFAALSGPASAETESGEEAHHASSGEIHHRNTAGVFVGATLEQHEEALAIGAEYERRIGETFGVGAVVEYTGGDIDSWVFAIPVALHAGHFKAYVAPGFEDGEHGTEGLVRLGAEYGFELSGGWELAPQANVDFVDGDHVWVLGVLFAKGF